MSVLFFADEWQSHPGTVEIAQLQQLHQGQEKHSEEDETGSESEEELHANSGEEELCAGSGGGRDSNFAASAAALNRFSVLDDDNE